MENETYPTTRQTNDEPSEKITTINNMTHMTEYVYEMYMKKLETIKDQLPTAAEIEMYRELPKENEEEGMEVEESAETQYEVIDEAPPAKRAAKETKKAEPKVFKPTPIVNEIPDEEEIPEKPSQEQEEETATNTEE